MMVSSTDTPFAKDGCPPLEDLAAFLDGRLSGEERARMTAHLADCERCYEVFAGAVRFQEDSRPKGGVILPFVKGDPVPWWKATAMAASALLAVGLGSFIGYQAFIAQPEMVVADLIEPLQSQEAANQLYDYSTYRGPGSEEYTLSYRPSFMVGVFLVDLRLSLAAGNMEPLEGLFLEIANEIEAASFGLMENESTRYRSLRDQIQDGNRSAALLRQLQEEAPEMEARLSGDQSMIDPKALAFGKWTEAARLAAVTRTPDFFDKRANWRFLGQVIEDKEKREASKPQDQASSEDPLGSELDWELEMEEDREAAVLGLLYQVRDLWKDEDMTEREYAALAETLNQIIKQYDP